MADEPLWATGTVVGFWETLRSAMRRLSTIPGASRITGFVHPVVVLPNYLEASYQASAGVTVPIGSSTTVVLTTVPQDERWTLFAVSVSRLSGDNTISSLQLTYPVAYRRGTTASQLYLAHPLIGAGITDVQLPNGSGAGYLSALRVVMEPGVTVDLTPNGVGAVATVFILRAQIMVTKVIRATP